jgi:hypothetical protein
MADSDDNSIKQNQRKQDVIQRKKKKDRKGKESAHFTVLKQI